MGYPDPTELTEAQKKAVAQLKRAFTAAKKAKIYFYMNLDNVFALNGKVVECVVTEDNREMSDCSMRDFPMPTRVVDRVLNPFADDEHYVIFNESAKQQGGAE